jgi:hypothetical protein
MTSLILHVGPGKCGSSSIQHFFATQKKPCVQETHYLLLNPLEFKEMNFEKPSESIVAIFTQLLSDNLIGCDVLILSHEHLFRCPYAIKNICSLAKNLTKNVSIIGYSRKQSDWLISAYSQWFFRSPDRIKETKDVLEKLKLDSVLFSGLERQLIASISNNFSGHKHINWHKNYQEILHLVHDSGAVIKCGVLPNRDADLSLVQDFCEKSDLTLRDEMKNVSKQVFNLSFNKDIVEAINNAVAFGLDMPGPHESNKVLDLLSTKMDQAANNSSDLLSSLKSYIDNYFSSSNYQFCQEYGLRETYFATAAEFSKADILDIIINEDQQRALNKSLIINNYRMLSAKLVELCLNLTKK